MDLKKIINKTERSFKFYNNKPDKLIKDLVKPKSELFNSANDSDRPMLTKLSIDASKRIICFKKI